MRRHPLHAIFALFALSAVWSGAQTCDLEWANPLPPRADLYRVFERSGLTVAVGANGTIATSLDSGASWQVPGSGTTADLHGVSWGFGHYVAVGDGVVLTSTNGRSWTERWRGNGVRLLDVDFGAGRLVAVGMGLGGAVLVSENGTSWSVHETGWEDLERAIVWGDDEFVAAGDGVVYGSSDGFEWSRLGDVPDSRKRVSAAYSISDRNDLAWDGESYIWVGGVEIYTSPSGRDWFYQHVLGGCDPWSSFLGVSAEPGRILVGAVSACPDPYINPNSQILLSTNGGYSWSTVYSERGNGVAAVVRAPAGYVAVGGAGEVLSSSNASAWSCLEGSCNAEACEEGFFDAARSGPGLLAVGGIGSCYGANKRIEGGTVAESLSGHSWSIAEISAGRLRSVAYDGARYVGVGENFTATSSDGVTWDQTSLSRVTTLHSVLWADDFFVAVGTGGMILTSIEGVLWDQQYSYTTADLSKVEWNGEDFVAVGSGGVVITSADGFNWSVPDCVCSENLNGVGWDGEAFIVVGDNGRMRSSEDLETWTEHYPGTRATLSDVGWDGEHLVAVGFDADDPALPAIVLASEDRIHWTRLPSIGTELERVVWTGQKILAMGGDRTLLQADCVAGPLIELDPTSVEMLWNTRQLLTLRLREHVGTAVVVQVSSSHPDAAVVPAVVNVPASGGPVTIPVDGVGLAEGVQITVKLPESLGGRSAVTVIDVVPPLPDPRRGAGRVGGRP